MAMTGKRPSGARSGSRELSLLVRVYAACATSGIDPDAWFPVSQDRAHASREAADALAVCASCLVRVHCLELSFRQWTIGQHGIWGGTLPDERKALRDRLADPFDFWPASRESTRRQVRATSLLTTWADQVNRSSDHSEGIRNG
jgi:hypothetical protein